MNLELSMHTLICGRARKHIKLIESATGTAIYFPPPFPRVFAYTPPEALRRPEDQIFITGKTREDILLAKAKIHDLVLATKVFMKPVHVTETKIDSILLERLDKVRKIIENNGTYVLFPPLGQQRGLIRVQGSDVLNVERTVRELMALVCSARYLLPTTLTSSRLANSTARPGSSPIPTLHSVHRLRMTSVPCSPTSALTLAPRSASRSSTSISTAPTML
jgi:hypothetical protein